MSQVSLKCYEGLHHIIPFRNPIFYFPNIKIFGIMLHEIIVS